MQLIDPVPLHVDQARAVPRLAGASLGVARALDWAVATVVAVLLLGQVYHLSELADRVRALAEDDASCARWRAGRRRDLPLCLGAGRLYRSHLREPGLR